MSYYTFLTLFSSLSIVVSGILVIFGLIEIKTKRRIHIHRNLMLSASFFAALFLILYIIKYFAFGPKEYRGDMRNLYLAVLFVHSLLASLNIPLVIITIFLALRKRFALHKKVAKITAPTWIIVALTGWIIFIFLTLGE
jgi:putative membrane protein